MEPVKVLLDLNVILDVLLARQSFYEPSAAVWTAAESQQVSGMIAAHSLSTLFYLYTKQKSASKASEQLRKMLMFFSVAPLDQATVERALSLNWDDFEDALQLAAAESCKADYLITRDREGFKKSNSPVTVISPAEFPAILQGSN